MILLFRRVLWASLALGALAAFAVANGNGAQALFDASPDLVALGEKLGLVLLIAVPTLALFGQKLSRTLAFAALWIVVGVGAVVGFNHRDDLRGLGGRAVAQLSTWTSAMASPPRTVEVTRGRMGDFALATEVNGARVPMVLDTGASAVVLTLDAARAAGLPIEILDYSVVVDTANGRTRAAPVTIDRISIGEVTERSISALIAQPGQLKVSLLGMSFLDRLESWEVRGDSLTMRAYR